MLTKSSEKFIRRVKSYQKMSTKYFSFHKSSAHQLWRKWIVVLKMLPLVGRKWAKIHAPKFWHKGSVNVPGAIEGFFPVEPYFYKKHFCLSLGMVAMFYECGDYMVNIYLRSDTYFLLYLHKCC